MKPIKELQIIRDLKVQINSSELFRLKRRSAKIDFDVYLESIGKNLQRGYVWDIRQKRELINSIIIGRNIPNLSIFERSDERKFIIDGKQRLSSMFDFLDDKFTIILEDKEYLFSELPKDYQDHIEMFNITYYSIFEISKNIVSEKMLFDWFDFINFAGTPQDEEHINDIKSKFTNIKNI